VLNHKLKDIEEEQQQINTNISNENKKHSGGIESEIDIMLHQARKLVEE
jgi:predicted phage-related endonuclease